MKAKTIGVAENGAKVNVNTLAAGSGKSFSLLTKQPPNCLPGLGAGSSTTTIVKSDKDVNVGRYIARVKNGENVITLANLLAIEFTARTNDRVVKGFREGLAKPDQGGRLFYKALEDFVKLQGCEACRRIFQGRELSFIPLNLPPVFYQCVYKRCSNYKTSAGCCNATQFKYKQCNCNGGRCLWGQPAKQGPFLKYWNCQQCGEKIPYCVCY